MGEDVLKKHKEFAEQFEKVRNQIKKESASITSSLDDMSRKIGDDLKADADMEQFSKDFWKKWDETNERIRKTQDEMERLAKEFRHG